MRITDMAKIAIQGLKRLWLENEQRRYLEWVEDMRRIAETPIAGFEPIEDPILTGRVLFPYPLFSRSIALWSLDEALWDAIGELPRDEPRFFIATEEDVDQ